jgi:hypothetical protein
LLGLRVWFKKRFVSGNHKTAPAGFGINRQNQRFVQFLQNFLRVFFPFDCFVKRIRAAIGEKARESKAIPGQR